MANYYTRGTGVLVLKKITPVILALFSNLELEHEGSEEGSEVYIAKIALEWESIGDRLKELVEQLKIQLPENAEPGIEEYLYALGSHFKQDDNTDLLNYIEHRDFTDNDGISLEELFNLAIWFDDGHGLSAIRFETAFWADGAGLFEFGGTGEYYGKHFCQVSASRTAIDRGPDIDGALAVNDIDRAATLLAEQVNTLLQGVVSESAQELLREKVAEKLVPQYANLLDLEEQNRKMRHALTILRDNAEAPCDRTIANECLALVGPVK